MSSPINKDSSFPVNSPRPSSPTDMTKKQRELCCKISVIGNYCLSKFKENSDVYFWRLKPDCMKLFIEGEYHLCKEEDLHRFLAVNNYRVVIFTLGRRLTEDLCSMKGFPLEEKK